MTFANPVGSHSPCHSGAYSLHSPSPSPCGKTEISHKQSTCKHQDRTVAISVVGYAGFEYREPLSETEMAIRTARAICLRILPALKQLIQTLPKMTDFRVDHL